MRDGRHTRGGMSTLEFEDVVTVDLPDDGYVDRGFLRDVFRDPHTYLPLRRRRVPRDLEDLPREVESALARRAKLAGLVTAVTALIGAVVAAAVLAERPTRGSGTGDSPQRSVTGIDALGAFTIAEASRLGNIGSASGAEASTTRAQPARSRATPQNSDAQPAEPAESSDPGSTTTSEPAISQEDHGESTAGSAGTGNTTEGTSAPATAPGARSADARNSVARTSPSQVTGKLETVRRFYSLVGSSPDQALGMLAPGLLGNALNELRAAWRSLEDVEVRDVRERPDGSVLADVTMRHADGTQVRMTQLFDFTSGGLIDHVQLLSAQHS